MVKYLSNKKRQSIQQTSKGLTLRSTNKKCNYQRKKSKRLQKYSGLNSKRKAHVGHSLPINKDYCDES